MATFESYERREKQILSKLSEYGIGSIDEAEKITKDVDKKVLKSEIQLEGKIKLGLSDQFSVFNAPGHVASYEVPEHGGSQPDADAADDGVFHLGDADIQVAVLIM